MVSTAIVEVNDKPISPESLINYIRTAGSGCVVTYVGLIRRYSREKVVFSVEYSDPNGKAMSELERIASNARAKWSLEGIAISHRTGRLVVGDINLVVAIASVHRQDGLDACRYVVDQFKEKLPTRKVETYEDGSVYTES